MYFFFTLASPLFFGYIIPIGTKKNPNRIGWSSLGVSAGIRTQDPILKRDVLYLLSYWDILLLTRPQKYTFFYSVFHLNPTFFIFFYICLNISDLFKKIFFIIFTFRLTLLLYLHNNILITKVLKMLCNIMSNSADFEPKNDKKMKILSIFEKLQLVLCNNNINDIRWKRWF